ncbi:MAG: hypothetical protein J0L84_13355, partial [Verrucomicrobia bacterium]|nr:hypothetical protein [Verrucomicrobiota bacterium]
MTPMHPATARVDVVAPAGRAWEHMRTLLFRPFDLTRWLVIGFTAWLAGLGESWGTGGGGNFQGGRDDLRRMDWDSMRLDIQDWLAANWMWLVPLVACGVVVLLVLSLLILWLSSRGRFLFLHNVTTGGAEVIAPWRTYAAHGNHLFFFRLLLAFTALAAALPIVGTGLIAGIRWLGSGDGAALAGVVAVLAAVTLGLLMTVFSVVSILTTDFVVPIMARHTASCRTGWRLFLGLLGSNPGGFALYLIFKLVVWIGVVVALIVGIVVTCCMLGCLLAIPFLGTVLFLPVLVF